MPSINQEQVHLNAEARILRRKQVESRTGLPRSSIYAKMAAGEFPAAISLGDKAVGWLDFEVDAWIAARVAASRPTTAK